MKINTFGIASILMSLVLLPLYGNVSSAYINLPGPRLSIPFSYPMDIIYDGSIATFGLYTESDRYTNVEGSDYVDSNNYDFSKNGKTQNYYLEYQSNYYQSKSYDISFAVTEQYGTKDFVSSTGSDSGIPLYFYNNETQGSTNISTDSYVLEPKFTISSGIQSGNILSFHFYWQTTGKDIPAGNYSIKVQMTIAST